MILPRKKGYVLTYFDKYYDGCSSVPNKFDDFCKTKYAKLASIHTNARTQNVIFSKKVVLFFKSDILIREFKKYVL